MASAQYKIEGFLSSGFFSTNSDSCGCGIHPNTPCISLMGSEVRKNQCEHEAPSCPQCTEYLTGQSMPTHALHRLTGWMHAEAAQLTVPQTSGPIVLDHLTALTFTQSVTLHSPTLSSHGGTQFCQMSNRGVVLHFDTSNSDAPGSVLALSLTKSFTSWSSAPQSHLCYRIFYSKG